MAAGESLGTQFFDPLPDPRAHLKAQPSLFDQRQMKPTDERRYQRGYTPERMAEVRENGPNIASLNNVHIDQSEPFDHPGFSHHSFGGPAGVRQAREVIARSTTPMHEFQGEGHHLLVQLGHNLKSASGQYFKPRGGRTDSVIKMDAHAGNLEVASGTLMHELGHHRSFVEGPGQGEYRTPSQVGKEEARADDNMVERWRPDPRDVRKGRKSDVRTGWLRTRPGELRTSPYEEGGGFRGKGASKAHAPYIKARTTLSTEEKRSIRVYGNRFGRAGRIASMRRNAQQDQATHIENTKLFHRDYRPGENSFDEAHWIPNTKQHNPAALQEAQFNGS